MSSIYIQYHCEDDAPCKCDDCGKTTPISELEMVSDIQERIDAGSIVPAGQCECGSLAYIVDEFAPSWSAQRRLYDLEKHAAVLSSLIGKVSRPNRI